MLLLVSLVALPTLAGIAAFLAPYDLGRRWLLVLAAAGHVGLVAAAWAYPPEAPPDSWISLDPAGKLFLTIASVLFLSSAIYCLGYLSREQQAEHDYRHSDEPENIFAGCLLLFLAAMTLVTMSQHLGLLWVAVEATTLASAPLIYFHRNARSLEATWKYLLICSVGIALALMGNFLLAVAATQVGPVAGETEQISLLLSKLIKQAALLDHNWLKAAFLFMLVGYGAKMGLAPMHTALPDADSEAPSAVGALLSGALLNCAFLAIVRIYQICAAAGEAAFCQNLFIGFGLLSMGVAGVFILGQTDFRRLLAYSSIEHMGILALGVGLGGPASGADAASGGSFGVALHAVNHSFAKAALFLLAGYIRQIYDTRQIADVRGVSRTLPITGVLWIALILAITGVPPFGPFVSEFTILKAAIDQEYYVIAAAYLGLLALVFIGMIGVAFPMAQGKPSELPRPAPDHEPLWAILSPGVLAAAVLALGLYLPEQVKTALVDAAKAWGGKS